MADQEHASFDRTAANIAGPLCALKDREQASLGQALAAVSWALVLLLQAMCLANPTAVEVTDALADARVELSVADAHLRRLDEQTADLASELHSVIAAAHDAMRATTGNGDARGTLNSTHPSPSSRGEALAPTSQAAR